VIGVERTDYLSVGTRDLERAARFYAFFADPDGNALALHRRYAPYSDGSMP
jgi:hypothetical protein